MRGHPPAEHLLVSAGAVADGSAQASVDGEGHMSSAYVGEGSSTAAGVHGCGLPVRVLGLSALIRASVTAGDLW